MPFSSTISRLAISENDVAEQPGPLRADPACVSIAGGHDLEAPAREDADLAAAPERFQQSNSRPSPRLLAAVAATDCLLGISRSIARQLAPDGQLAEPRSRAQRRAGARRWDPLTLAWRDKHSSALAWALTSARSRGCRTNQGRCTNDTTRFSADLVRAAQAAEAGPPRPKCFTADSLPCRDRTRVVPPSWFVRQPLAKAIARRAPAGERKRSPGRWPRDARHWASGEVGGRHRWRPRSRGSAHYRLGARLADPVFVALGKPRSVKRRPCAASFPAFRAKEGPTRVR